MDMQFVLSLATYHIISYHIISITNLDANLNGCMICTCPLIIFTIRQSEAQEIRIEERCVITQLDANYNCCILSVFLTFKRNVFYIRLTEAQLILNQSRAQISYHFSASIRVRHAYEL